MEDRELKELINEKALLGTLSTKEFHHLRRLGEIDKEIKQRIEILANRPK